MDDEKALRELFKWWASGGQKTSFSGLGELFNSTGLVRKRHPGPCVNSTGLEKITGPCALRGIQSIGLYFGGRWSPDCTAFLDELKPFYRQYKALDSQFEIIYISTDNSAAEARGYFGQLHGNWLMMPFNRSHYEALSSHYDIDDIPSLVIVGVDGSVITKRTEGILRRPPAKVATEGTLKPLPPAARLVLSPAGKSHPRLRQSIPNGRVVKLVRRDDDGNLKIEFGSEKMATVPRDCVLIAPQPANFKVGNLVRVMASLEPWFCWGAVRGGQIGFVKSRKDRQTLIVEFPGAEDWKADVYDLELVAMQPWMWVVGRRVKVTNAGLSVLGSLTGIVDENGHVKVDLDKLGRRAIRPTEIVPVLRKGCRVTAFNLQCAAELNGCEGAVESDGGKRLHVKFDGGVVKSLKEDNLSSDADPKLPPPLPPPPKQPLPKVADPKLPKKEPVSVPVPVPVPVPDPLTPEAESLRRWLIEKDLLGEGQATEAIEALHREGVVSVEDAEDLSEDELRKLLPKLSLAQWLKDILHESTLTSALEQCESHGLTTVAHMEDLADSPEKLTDKLGSIFKLGVAKRISKSLGSFASSTQIPLPGSKDGSLAFQVSSHFKHLRHDQTVKVIAPLGKGSFGTAYLVEVKGERLALKIVDAAKLADRSKSDDPAQHYQEALKIANLCFKESLNMAKLEHPFIVRLVDAKFEAPRDGALEVRIFMEFCEGGDLAQTMKKDRPMQLADVLNAVGCIASALSFMHSRDIIHRDVKPSNVLLTGQDPVMYKLADLGLARADSGTLSTRGIAGTFCYMSPDAFRGSGGRSVDVFALGRMAIALATWSAPIDIVNTPEQVNALVERLPDVYEPQSQLFASMMSMDSEQRPTADQIEKQLAVILADCSPSNRYATMMNLGVQLQNAGWLRHQQVQGLQWQELTGHVKVCHFRPIQCSLPEAAALAQLTTMIELSPSCADFSQKYVCQEVILSKSRSRESGLLANVLNLETQYRTNPHLYDLTHLLGPASSENGIWRRKVQDYFKRYPNLEAESRETRVCMAFHTVPSMDVASSIMKGDFANLTGSSLDDGFIGIGVYLTFDLDYAFDEYGVNIYGLEEVPVIVCAVVVGNPFPVIECPECDPANGKCCGACDDDEVYRGKAIVSGAGAHIAVMGHDPEYHDYGSNPLPAHYSRWGSINPVTEICVHDDKVLPLGVFLVKRKPV